MTRVLILGGTGDARRLAALATAAGYDVIVSLAGRTADPGRSVAASRTGGFGGAEGLAEYLRAEHIDLVIDATHPFAAQISAHAADAAQVTGVPHAALDRPRWKPEPGDRWVPAASTADAAAKLAGIGRRVFLSLGRQELATFVQIPGVWFLYRLVEAPAPGTPRPQGLMLLDRGPFAEPAERDLLLTHRIDVVVTRNSGGDETYPKILAARALALPVVMIERPPPPLGDLVYSPAEALAWLHSQTTAND